MEIDHKIKGLEKMFNKLVVPKVNSLEEHTGFKILDIRVQRQLIKKISGTKVTGYLDDLLDKPTYRVDLTVSFKKGFSDSYNAEDFYVLIGHLFLNAYDYIVPNGYLWLNYNNEQGKYLGDDQFQSDSTRYPDSKIIKHLLKIEWDE